MDFAFNILERIYCLGLTTPENAGSVDYIASLCDTNVEDVVEVIDRLSAEGYLDSYSDEMGGKKFYLTKLGIMTVMSLYT